MADYMISAPEPPELLPETEQTSPPKPSRRFLFLSLGVLVLLSGAFLFYRSSVVYKTEVSEFELKPQNADSAGVAEDSGFTLKTTAPLSAQVIEKYLKIVPLVSFRVEKARAEENTFEVIPSEKLEANKIYTLKIEKGPLASRDWSWAYQVKAPFAVVSSLPRDKSADAPTNTGIEIDFNRDDITYPEKFIEIIPATTGKFETIGNKVRFIPKSPLSEKTLYAIRIKSGLGAENTEDILANEKVIQFETAENYYGKGAVRVSFNRQFSEFKPNSEIVFGLHGRNTEPIFTTLYRFNSAEAYLENIKKSLGSDPWRRYHQKIDTTLLEERKVFSGSILPEGSEYAALLRLPEKLAEGYYLLIAGLDKQEDLSWFQVSPTASFATFASGKSLLWLKDIATGNNISGAPIFFAGKKIGETGADGVALFDTPEDLLRKPTETDYYFGNNIEFLLAKIPNGSLVIPIEDRFGYSHRIEPKDKWWDFVSLNKNIYLPTDTVRFWSIIKERQGEDLNGEISVALTNPYWQGSEDSIATYGKANLRLSDFGAVTGEISFVNLKPGIYELTFRKGEEIVAKQTVSVNAYVKPAYKITVEPDKDAIFAGEAVSFKVKAEFFDGTPVPNLAFSYSAYGPSDHFDGQVNLNQDGEGFMTLSPKYDGGQTYWPSYLSVNFRPAGAEGGQIEASASILVFGPRVQNTISQSQTDGTVSFNIKARTVILKDGLSGKPYWDSENYLGEPLPKSSTKVNVFEVIYIKEQTGTGYDSINKLTYPIYNYRTEERPLSSQDILSTDDGVAHFSFNTQSGQTYKFIFETSDNAGRVAKDIRYAYGGTGAGTSDSLFGDSFYLAALEASKNYTVGEPFNLRLKNYHNEIPTEGENKFIFLTVLNGDIDYKIQNSPSYRGLFQSRYPPNVQILPGWFEGGLFRDSYPFNISFDANEKRLKIAVTKDKELYKPGEEVSLAVKVADKNNNPVRAEVNLSALDEAVFSLRPDERDTVNELYRDIYSPIIVRTSNIPPYGGGGAEKGGGDGDGVRSDIKEVAIWKTVQTDSQGLARVSFKLPDNLTSWRLTTQAVTKDLFAGRDIHFIPVSLPFFVDITLNKTYLAGDSPNIRLRAFGTSATEESVSYALESPTLPFKEILKTGLRSIYIPIGRLTEGTHKITARAKQGGLSDALESPLQVLPSYFTRKISSFSEGAPDLKIKNDALGYTTLAFSSYGRGRLYNELKSLSYESGLRLDQRGAGKVASGFLNQFFKENNEVSEFEPSKYQVQNGGLSLLPYSDDDLELSALSAHLFGETDFDRVALKNYFTTSLSNEKADSGRIVRALYGLAASHEPILNKIQSIKYDKSLERKDKVFVALALDSLGAKEEARKYYKDEIRPEIETKLSYAYLKGLKGDDVTVTTALVATLAISLEEPEAAPLSLYSETNAPKETLLNFERLLYLKTALPKLSGEEVGFSYEFGERRGQKILKDGEIFTITISPAELSSMRLSDVKGKLGITASYEEQSSPSAIVKDGNLFLARSYSVNGVVSKKFKEGDLVRVDLNPSFGRNALDGAYQITDYLPSGLRAIDNEQVQSYFRGYGYKSRIYPTEINDQKVSFVVYKNSYIPIYYYARVVGKGEYRSDSASIQSLRNLSSVTVSDEDKVAIE